MNNNWLIILLFNKNTFVYINCILTRLMYTYIHDKKKYERWNSHQPYLINYWNSFVRTYFYLIIFLQFTSASYDPLPVQKQKAFILALIYPISKYANFEMHTKCIKWRTWNSGGEKNNLSSSGLLSYETPDFPLCFLNNKPPVSHQKGRVRKFRFWKSKWGREIKKKIYVSNIRDKEMSAIEKSIFNEKIAKKSLLGFCFGELTPCNTH